LWNCHWVQQEACLHLADDSVLNNDVGAVATNVNSSVFEAVRYFLLYAKPAMVELDHQRTAISTLTESKPKTECTE
jgi:hypothetical protein